MTHRLSVREIPATVHMDWKTSLGRMELGERLLVHGLSQAAVGGKLARYNRDGRRFVSKRMTQGIYVIRVE